MLCLKFPALALGRPVCGPVYRNIADGQGETSEFTYVNALGVKHFDVAK